MSIKYIDGKRLKRLLIAGSIWLVKHKDILNELNVYPVPDGDTGTNMSMTFKAIEDELAKVAKEENVSKIVHIVTEAALLGARGNSGTILSQILYGFLNAMMGKERIYAVDVAKALIAAKESAYKSVNIPVEGTILTIIRRVSEEALALVESNKETDLETLIAHIRKVAEQEVEKTQETLPQLKEAGVVDAGAKGFYYVLEGFEKLIKDEAIVNDIEEKFVGARVENIIYKANPDLIKHKYCTEFIIEETDENVDNLREKIEEFGDSIIAAKVGNKIKIHIHTNNPGLVLELALGLGELTKIKIDNMKIQHDSIVEKSLENEGTIYLKNNDKKTGIIAVADTVEIGEMFLKRGAEVVITGGQGNNPSVGDIEEAIGRAEGKSITILPNNKNIISAAKLAKDRADREAKVIETKSMLEGYFVIRNCEDEYEILDEKRKANISVEITNAAKNTSVEGLEIKKNDFIALINGKIEYASEKQEELIEKIFEKYADNTIVNTVVISGKDIAENTEKLVQDKIRGTQFEKVNGMQDNYSYYIYFEKRGRDVFETAIITDSASDLEPHHIKGLPITVVPLKVDMGNGYKKDNGIEITKAEFWRDIYKLKEIPKTSQPSPAEFLETYKSLFEKGYKKILYIHVSGKKSGSNQAALTAKNLLQNRDQDIKIVDSGMISMPIGVLVIQAAKLAKDGIFFEEIIDITEKNKKNLKLFIIPVDLEYLKKGGRIGKAASFLGGILHLKPVLEVKDGEIFPVKKVFGMNNGIKYLEGLIKIEASKGNVEIINLAGGNKEVLTASADLLKKQKKMKNVQVIYETIAHGPVTGSHAGPGFGVVIIKGAFL